MFAISEIAPGGSQNGQSQSQQHVIASVIALQRVIAGRAGSESGNAAGHSFSNQHEKAARLTMRSSVEARANTSQQTDTPEQASGDSSASARSVFEAQEASRTDAEIVAAFQARHGFSDLLSVIRDPEDRVLPTKPQS